MSVLRRVWQSLRIKYKRVYSYDQNDSVMPWTIIKNNMSHKEYKKRFRAIHQRFKYRFLIPVLLIGYRIIGKWITKQEDIPKEQHNAMIRGYVDSFDLSLKEWCIHYRKGKMKEALQDYKNDSSIDLLRKMNDILVTLYMHDTAYRVFFDMLMINMTIKMGELYPDKIGKFMYKSKHINDVDYRVITHTTDQNLMINMGDHFLAFKKGDGWRINTVDMKSILLNHDETWRQECIKHNMLMRDANRRAAQHPKFTEDDKKRILERADYFQSKIDELFPKKDSEKVSA